MGRRLSCSPHLPSPPWSGKDARRYAGTHRGRRRRRRVRGDRRRHGGRDRVPADPVRARPAARRLPGRERDARASCRRSARRPSAPSSARCCSTRSRGSAGAAPSCACIRCCGSPSATSTAPTAGSTAARSRSSSSGGSCPGIRSLVSVPAGLSEMPLHTFLAATAAGALLWNSALLGAGVLLGAQYDRVEGYVGPVEHRGGRRRRAGARHGPGLAPPPPGALTGSSPCGCWSSRTSRGWRRWSSACSARRARPST